MKISTRTHGREFTAWVGVRDSVTKMPIALPVVGADTDRRTLTLVDADTKVQYELVGDFELYDRRTGGPLSPQQVADIERNSTERCEQLADALLDDLDERSGKMMDAETRAVIRTGWVKLIEDWRNR